MLEKGPEKQPRKSQKDLTHISRILPGVMRGMRPAVRLGDISSDDLIDALVAIDIENRGQDTPRSRQQIRIHQALAEASSGHLEDDGVVRGAPEEIDDYVKKMSETAREFEA